MAGREYDFFMYIVASRSRQLYVGVTNSLERRMREYREHRPGTYTAHYKIDRLVYYEHFQYVLSAITRETEVKDWNREKKLKLINSVNPTWQDLSERWGRMGAVTETKADSFAALRNDNSTGLRDDNPTGLRNDNLTLLPNDSSAALRNDNLIFLPNDNPTGLRNQNPAGLRDSNSRGSIVSEGDMTRD